MSEFKPVSTLEDLNLQDTDELVAGYRAGLRNLAEPGSDQSRAYWHGWRNGQVDRGNREPDVAQAELARRFILRQRAH